MTPEELVESAGVLISLPRAYQRISEMLDDPRYSTSDIGRVIGHEPALAARVLRLANSSYHGVTNKIDSIPAAIHVLGTRNLRDMLLATSVARAFARINTHLVDVADFWHHSIYCGILARLLGQRLKLDCGEQLFVAGLLHDLGKLVLYLQLPEQSEQILQEAARSGEPIERLEQQRLGFDHAAVGQALLTSWELPELYCDVAGYHHSPERSRYPLETGVVHVANALTEQVEPGHKLGSAAGAPKLHPQAAALTSLDPELIEELRLRADVESVQVFTTLFSSTPPTP